jgi:hypothetical protein
MRLIFSVVASGLLLALSAAPSRAQERVSDLLVWVPDKSNLILFVDVDAMRNSALAKKEKWGSGNHVVSGLDTLPPGITKLVVASHFDPGAGMSWEVIVAGTRKPITDADLLKGTGGTLDNLAGKNVVLTSHRKFAVNLDKGVVGAYQPANRQDAGRWLREVDGKISPRFSPYLSVVGAGVVATTPVVLALDTRDMFAPELVKVALAKSQTLKGKPEKIAAIADLIGKMRYLSFSIHLSDVMTGELMLDFGAACSELKDVAKPLLLEILDRLGMHNKEMDGWTVNMRNTTVTFTGPLSKDGAQDIISPMLQPSLGSLDQTEPAPMAQSKAQASLKFYQATKKKIDEVWKSSSSSYSKLTTTFNNAARHIDELPMLNVDDELLDWGHSVATTFRTMGICAQKAGGMISLAEANKQLVVASTPNYYTGAVGGYAGGYYGGYGWGYQYAVPSGSTSTATASNYGQVQNMQNMTSQNEAIYRRETWKNIDNVTNDIRRKMTKKYNIEFESLSK